MLWGWGPPPQALLAPLARPPAGCCLATMGWRKADQIMLTLLPAWARARARPFWNYAVRECQRGLFGHLQSTKSQAPGTKSQRTPNLHLPDVTGIGQLGFGN